MFSTDSSSLLVLGHVLMETLLRNVTLPVFVMKLEGVFTDEVEVSGEYFVTVSLVHPHGVRSLLLAAPVTDFVSVYCVRPPDFCALEVFHHCFPSCNIATSRNLMRTMPGTMMLLR